MDVKIAGGSLRCRVEGTGPALVCLHAFPLSLEMWDHLATSLAPTHQVIRFDARGHGGTPPGDGILTMERIADDAAGLLDHLGIAQATIMGCSMGGYAALAFARRHAARLSALALVDTRAEADGPEARAGRSRLAESIRRDGVEAAVEAFLPRLLGKTSHAERPDLVARMRDWIRATPSRGLVDALAGLAARADSTPGLPQIRVPTLVVCGEEDEITPPATAQAMAAAISGARLVLLPSAGHLPSLETPEAFDAAILGFLSARPR